MEFEWDLQKAEINFKKHGVTLEEAATVFGDYLSLTYPDIQHSFQEERFIMIGVSDKNRILIISHTQQGETIRIINARQSTKRERDFMNQENSNEPDDELPEEYDFSKMEGGVRGKYAKQYHEGAKLIMLDADVAKIFPDAKSVNEALRTLSKIVLQHQAIS